MSQVTGTSRSPKRDLVMQEMRSHFRSKYLNSPQLLTRIDEQISQLSQLKRISPKDIERTERSLKSLSNQCSTIIPQGHSQQEALEAAFKVPKYVQKQSPTPLPFKIGLDEEGTGALQEDRPRRSSFASFPRTNDGGQKEITGNGIKKVRKEKTRVHQRSLLNPNKTSVWAAMIMHDQLKFKEEEMLREERLKREKAELRNFYHTQIQSKLREENKMLSERRKHESETIEKTKLEQAQEQTRLRFKKHQWAQTVRKQYLKSLERGGSSKISAPSPEGRGGAQYWPYEKEFDHTLQTKKQRQWQHLQDLSQIISENQMMKKKQKKIQALEDRDYLDFVSNSILLRDAKENNLKKRIAEQLQAREEMFKIQGNNLSVMEQIKNRAQESRHARMESEIKRQEQAEESRKKLRQASLKTELLQKLAEMNEQRLMQNELLKISTKRQGEEARKRADEYKQQLAEEKRRYLEKKEMQKKEMMQEMKKDVEIRRKNKQLDLLNGREFGLNKYKLMEMGIFEEKEQATLAGDFTHRKQQEIMLNTERT